MDFFRIILYLIMVLSAVCLLYCLLRAARLIRRRSDGPCCNEIGKPMEKHTTPVTEENPPTPTK